MSKRAIRALRKRDTFLGTLGKTASVTHACKVARLPRRTAYDWRASDPEFEKAWDDAVELGTDALEDEAIRRAREGTLKPAYQQGRKVGTVREYSDTLLIFMLMAQRPEKFRDSAAIQRQVLGALQHKTLEDLVLGSMKLMEAERVDKPEKSRAAPALPSPSGCVH